MVLEITNSEKDLIFELVETAHREVIHEIDHTDTREFRKLLQQKLGLLEQIGAKVGAAQDKSSAVQV
jgi:hypothetical protein